MRTKRGGLALLVLFLAAGWCAIARQSAGETRKDTLTFQSHRPWSPRINLNADAAMAYGIDSSLPQRMESWRRHGYRVQVMTGVAWGQYQDYLNGTYDGKNHWNEAQTDRNGAKVLHGGNKEVPYISPSEDYGRYLTVGIKRALDNGAEAIYLEEPEFWARSGYSESFKREWQAYYGEPWQRPDSSVDAQYRASKLKYFLYRRALSQVFDFVKKYGEQHGRSIPCYVPTHSLLNYAHWRIVSPESSLIKVGADGYIAQVWTGTARTPNAYEGQLKERTFETAFLEYGAMQNLVRASGRRVWYLNDPIEDNPNHDWSDYRRNWESTLTASLLQPEVSSYEIMPWPERIFTGKYPVHAGDTVQRVGIPKPYETELQAVIHALGEMKQPLDAVKWEMSGTQGIGVLVSDTMMFQRADPTPSDPNLGSFYGLAMPLLKRGIPVEPVQLEDAAAPGFLDHYRVLLLTYEGQKPSSADLHRALAKWVREGGALVVVDNDRDPYLSVRQWWNSAGNHYQTPRQHLFDQLRIRASSAGLHRFGKGVVVFEEESPAALTYQADGAERVRAAVKQAASRVGLRWKEANALVLRRGPYVIAAGLDESASGAASLHGHFIDLFDPALPEVETVTLSPGSRTLLFDLDAQRGQLPKIAGAACRVLDEAWKGRELAFRTDGIAETNAVIRIASAAKPVSIRVGAVELPQEKIAIDSRSFSFSFENSAAGVPIRISFTQ